MFILDLKIYFFVKRRRNISGAIGIGTLTICLLLNFSLANTYYNFLQKQNRLSEHDKYKTCAEMEQRFHIDLQKDELKYFHFGMGSMMGMERIMESEYGIEYYEMGCSVQTEMDCYNTLVDKHIQSKYYKSIVNIYSEVDTFPNVLETE